MTRPERWWLAIGILAAMGTTWLVLATRPLAPDRGSVRVRDTKTTIAPPLEAPRAMLTTPAIAPRPKVLRALQLPPGTPITSMVRDDPRDGTMCGSVMASDGRSTRFVYLGAAGLAALDDGAAEFATLYRRVCGG